MENEDEVDFSNIEKEDLTKEAVNYSPWIESYTENIYEEINETAEDNQEEET
jgi:hypothetical protein